MLNSCGKDELLQAERADYLGSELRVDGYYFLTYDNNIISIRFFNRNGILLDGPAPDHSQPGALSELEDDFRSGKYYNDCKNIKTDWGIFSISGDRIRVDRWGYGDGGPLPSVVETGVILSKTSFRIDKVNNRYVTPEIYQFKHFPYKPDSVCKFIP